MIIDRLDDVQQLLHEGPVYRLLVNLSGSPASNNYPQARLSVNNTVIWTGAVKEQTVLDFPSLFVAEHCFNLQLEYFGKTDNDTVVKDNKIVENQSVCINGIGINDVEIGGHDLIAFSNTDYSLTESQQSAYNSNGFHWKSVKTDTLWDNGIWKLSLDKPVIASLIRQKHVAKQVFELSHTAILNKLQNYFRE